MQNTGKSGGTNEPDHTHTRWNGEILGSSNSRMTVWGVVKVGDGSKVHTAGREGLKLLYKKYRLRSHEIVSDVRQ